MSFVSYIEHLRTKPEHVRRHYAFWSSFGFTAIVFMFWVASFTTMGATAQSALADAVDRAGTPAASLVASVGSIFTDIKGMIFGSRKITYPVVQVGPGRK